MLAVAARRMGQPLRWLATRGEDLLARRPFAEEAIADVVTSLRPAEDRSFAAANL